MNDKKKLLIVESPAKIKTISKFLGRDFVIVSTFGHIKDLPSKRLGIVRNDKDGSITLEYEPIPDKEEKIAAICKQAGAASEIFLAPDPDREGEIIAWHTCQEILKVIKKNIKIHRITFNEITKPAVTEAIEHKGEIDEHKVQAQQARRILDRWVGYEVSPLLWKKIARGLSAGRVQSVAVMLVCNREEEILSFKPEESWSITAIFACSGKDTLSAELFKIKNKSFKLKDKTAAEKAVAAIKKVSFIVSKITEKERARKPAPPFMTSTLQQDAYNKLGFSVDKTMSVAQRLYEGIPLADKDTPEALITYMRTDSLRISDTAIKQAKSFIKQEFGDKYYPKTTHVYAKKGAQDAHEAIRPVNIDRTPESVKRYLKPEEAKLYGLIWKRFVACQMANAEYFQRQVLLEDEKKEFTFKATGSTLMFDGFLKVYEVEEDEEKETAKIPKSVKEAMAVALQELLPKQHFTQPPPRYTEATLVKELEAKGIGRPSTYAAILSTVQKRKYIEKNNKRFGPTELGKTVNAMLVKNFPDIINVSFTAEMETRLDDIAHNKADRDKVLNAFYKSFAKDLKAFGKDTSTKQEALETDIVCPSCGKKKLLIRFGRTGEFMGCPSYPECTFTSNFVRNEEGKLELSQESKVNEESSVPCPNCGKLLVKKIGRYGPFLSCPGYPECKYIHQDALKTPCPECKGKLVKKRWRGGIFWGCANYPTCKFSVFGDVEETPCRSCKNPFLIIKKKKDGKTTLTCPNKACGLVVEKNEE